MSTALKAITILSGVALTGAATVHTIKHRNDDFSAASLRVTAIDVLRDEKPMKKLPSEYFSFTVRNIRFSNAA